MSAIATMLVNALRHGESTRQHYRLLLSEKWDSVRFANDAPTFTRTLPVLDAGLTLKMTKLGLSAGNAQFVPNLFATANA